MDRSVTCLISGSRYTLSKEYFNKKVEEYGDVDSLKKYYVTKKVKSLILRGYSVVEIRNILSVSGDDVCGEVVEIDAIINYHKGKSNITTRKNTSNFSMHRSDSDVVSFINNIKKYDQEKIYSTDR